MNVRGTTRVLGILGDPVTHSLSPVIHNAALQASGIDAVYVPFHVYSAGLAAAVAGVRALNLAGLSVTVPHKEAILPLLDEIDSDAQRIGAVNTVVNRAGRLIGFNTDATGFIRALRDDLGFDPRQRRILLIGAGGACRAALAALAREGAAWIGIANRTVERAAALVERYAPEFSACQFVALALDSPALLPVLPRIDLIVNTSALGLKGEHFDFPLCENMSRTTCVFDMVYSPGGSETPLVASARLAGLRAIDGRAMLVAQGEEAFFLWTGVAAPPGVMVASLPQVGPADKTIELSTSQ